jgi:hypothetical protein
MKTTPIHCKMSFVLFINELYAQIHLLSTFGKNARTVSRCIPAKSIGPSVPMASK